MRIAPRRPSGATHWRPSRQASKRRTVSGPIILFGAGGHAKVVLESLLLSHPDAAVQILDDAFERRPPLLGRPVTGGRGWLEQAGRSLPVVPAIGSNAVRSDLIGWLRERGHVLRTVVDPRSCVSASAELGPGAFVAAGAVINAETRIGEGAIVNTRASIDHDCRIGFAAHIAPGATLCGAVEVGPRTLIGAGATLIPGVKVGADALVGAGAVALGPVPDGWRVSGNPARRMRPPPGAPAADR